MNSAEHLQPKRPAFGKPGIEPRWTASAKFGVGTAYSTASTVWYTLFRGVLNEIYYPTIDRPQTRDFQYLITDGKSFFHEEKRHLHSRIELLSDHALGFRVTSNDPDERYHLVKEILSNPHQNCLLISTKLDVSKLMKDQLKLYALLAPHIEAGGWHNNGYVIEISGQKILVACRDDIWIAMAATVPLVKASCGYVGASDGWTDISKHLRMDWEFDAAEDGNIALTGELDLSRGTEFVLGIAFGNSLHNAATILFQSLDLPFETHKKRFVEQWERAENHILPIGAASSDGAKLYHLSHSLLAAHEDKLYQGAMIASLSIPWGEIKGDDDIGGYHLVWTRDLVHSAAGLLAAGSTETPLRSLIYLACTQLDEGGFYQNFWIDGEPYWKGVQLDEAAFPIILAHKLYRSGALREFDWYPMVLSAARFLIESGPVTPQERWEENSGYSPSTLAAHIAGLICAALFADFRGDKPYAQFIREYADFLESHVVDWTVTTQGTLVPGIPRHFIRLKPIDLDDPAPNEDPNAGILELKNQPPGAPIRFPAKEIVDGGFLELVRWGIMKPDDPIVLDSLQVIDKILKVDTPFGPCWRRYNHDGYGQKDDGGPYDGWGTGRAWPLLTGERGHYELAAGRDPTRYIQALEGFAKATGLLPEQVWDSKDIPKEHLYLGKPTGSAMPLMWAHGEYIKLLRSTKDQKVFDFIPEVAERYQKNGNRKRIEYWKFSRQPGKTIAGSVLRILAGAPFQLRWSSDEWKSTNNTQSSHAFLSIHFVDIPVPPEQRAPIRFTFFWSESGRWEGKDFQVQVESKNS